MDWLTDLMITFAAVAANHLGLVSAIERMVKHRLPIVDCPKCLSFWAVIGYGIVDTDSSLFTVHYSLTLVAVALLAAWAAIWLELAMGFIDKLYLKAYEQIYPTADSTDADA